MNPIQGLSNFSELLGIFLLLVTAIYAWRQTR